MVGAIIPDAVKILSTADIELEDFCVPQTLGNIWLDTKKSAVLRVPSIIIPGEFNYLLNPQHQDFGRIVAEIPWPFMFDERLFG